MNPELAATMQAAWEAGLSVMPVGRNKRPTDRWARFIDQRCELDQLHTWMTTDCGGYGVICGGPSRLLVLDIEARFMDRLGDLRVALEGAGMLRTFETWLEGYSVATPGGGMHVGIHLGGDDPVPGNEKLAMLDGLVAVETRGQGGYVVGPGSNGDTHPSGGTWTWMSRGGFETIAWTTVAEWELVRRILVGFDVAPVLPSPPAVRAPAPRTASWIDAALDAYPPIEQVLTDHGWVPARSSDQYGQHWVRPGKQPREGHSASLSANSRLYVHSTNAGLPTGNPTLDALDVELAYRLGRRPTPDERVAELRRWSPATATVQASARSTTGEASSPPAMNPSLRLPDEFWQARPYLNQLAQAAWSRQTSPDLVWESFKAMYASTIPWNFRLPNDGTLDYIAVMVGDSGSGKTDSKRLAASLLPLAIFEIEGLNPLLPSPASGEGMAEWYMDRSKNAPPGALANRGGCFYLDEGQAFFDRANRQGNIVVQTMKSAWSGESIGSLAAAADRRRVIMPSAVRVCVLVSIQIDAAAQFLAADLTAGGLPQRISWAWAYHDSIPDEPGEWSGTLDVPVYDYHHWGGSGASTVSYQVTVAPEIQAEVYARRLERRRAPQSDVLDVHADLATLKTAAILALLDDRKEVNPTDWNLASMDWAATSNVRSHVLAQRAESAQDRITSLGRNDAIRSGAAQSHKIDLAAGVVGRKVWRSDTPILWRQAKDAVQHLKVRPFSVICNRAADLGYIVIHKGEGLKRGEVRPPK